MKKKIAFAGVSPSLQNIINREEERPELESDLLEASPDELETSSDTSKPDETKTSQAVDSAEAEPRVESKPKKQKKSSARKSKSVSPSPQPEPKVNHNLPLPQSIIRGLRQASFERKMAGIRPCTQSDLITMALREFLIEEGVLEEES